MVTVVDESLVGPIKKLNRPIVRFVSDDRHYLLRRRVETLSYLDTQSRHIIKDSPLSTWGLDLVTTPQTRFSGTA
jgi:hypothetical protein